MKLIATSDNVFRCADSPAALDDSAFAALVEAARRSPLRRARVCMHPASDAPIHEMLIVLLKGSYIRPHKHLGKSESFHLIQGTAGVLFYDDQGRIERQLTLSRDIAHAPFYYRLDRDAYHSQVVLSEHVVFHECTGGPFRREDTAFAPWSPEDRTAEAERFLAGLENRFESALAHA